MTAPQKTSSSWPGGRCGARGAGSIDDVDAPILSAVGVKDGGELLRCATAPSVYMWQMEDDMVYLDGVDERFQAATGSTPSELIFVSRHASDSGKPTLTVHPIGEARPFLGEPLEAFHYQPPITEHQIQNPTPGIPNPKFQIRSKKPCTKNKQNENPSP